MRSMVNWWSGLASVAATSVLVLVPTALAAFASARLGAAAPVALVSHRHPEAFDDAVDVGHAGADAEEEKHQQTPGPRSEPAITRPSDGDADEDRDHQLEADAETETHRRSGRLVSPPVGRAPPALSRASRSLETLSQRGEGI